MAPRLEKINPGDLTITEGLSAEGFEVYKDVLSKLQQGPSKQAKMAARMNAILFARMADRMAELHKAMGQKKYTALDFYNSVQLDATGNAGVGFGLNMAVTNTKITLDTEVKVTVLKRMFHGKKWYDLRELFIKEYPDIVNEVLTDPKNTQKHIPHINLLSNAKVIISKGSIENILSDHTSSTENDEEKLAIRRDVDRYELLQNLPELIKNGVLVEEHEDKHGDAQRIYRLFAPVYLDNDMLIVKLTLKRERNIFKLAPDGFTYNRLYDATLAKEKEPIERPQSADYKSGSHAGSLTSSYTVSIAELLKGVNDNAGKPYINEDGSLNVDFTLNTNTFEQRAYNGSYNQSAGTMAITANTQLLEQAKNIVEAYHGRSRRNQNGMPIAEK